MDDPNTEPSLDDEHETTEIVSEDDLAAPLTDTEEAALEEVAEAILSEDDLVIEDDAPAEPLPNTDKALMYIERGMRPELIAKKTQLPLEYIQTLATEGGHGMAENTGA